MQNHSKDIFEATNKTNNKTSSNSSNFFLTDDSLNFDILKKNSNDKYRRLNDYDFNLLKEDAYKDVSDDLFKLEYKISKTEEEIKSLESQIQAGMEINDNELVTELQERLKQTKEDYESLVAIYNDKSLSARVSDSISNIFGDKLKNSCKLFQEKLNNISVSVIKKLPKPFSSIIELKASLNKLESINRSVDELISMNIPYGENINKYEQLSKYIIKANSIQGELARYMKK